MFLVVYEGNNVVFCEAMVILYFIIPYRVIFQIVIKLV